MKRFDCEICARREDCPDREAGRFCTQWQSKDPDPGRVDPNPEGWEPEDEDYFRLLPIDFLQCNIL